MYQDKKTKTDGADELLARDGRAMPFSDEAEKGLLSCVIQEPETRLHEARRRMLAEAFYHPANRIIWEKILELADANKPIDPVLLTQLLRDQHLLDQIGGPGVVSELFTFVPIPSHFPYYMGIVLDKWALRQVMRTAAEIIDEAHLYGKDTGHAGDAVSVVTSAESKMFGLVEQLAALGESQGGAMPASRGVEEWCDHMERTISNRGKITGLTTGIHEIDLTLHGIDDKEGEICVIAGRPGMGKTAMACTIAHHLAVERGIPGLIFSIEMSQNQLYTRLILGPAGIDTAKGISGHFSKPEQDAMMCQAIKVQKSPMHVCGSSAASTADLRAQVQLAKRRHHIRWIMVDHLHLVKSADPRTQGDERMRLVEVMETLQFLKKEHHLGVFLLVQMARESDRAAGKAPVLADLAGSAAIEQYADHVIFIHREEMFVPWHRISEDKQKDWADLILPRRGRSPELWSDGLKYDEESGGFARQDYEEKAILFVRKNRRGPTPELQVRYQKEFTRFSTRMPNIQSTNPLDHQMGTYTASNGAKRNKDATKAKPIGKSRVVSLDEAFPD